MSKRFSKEDKKLDKWLDKHNQIKKIVYFCHIISKPVAFIILIITLIGIIFGAYLYFTNEKTVSNNEELTPQNDLKNYTLNLCQELTEFKANRDLNRPDILDYSDTDDWLKDVDDYDDQTLSQYKVRFSTSASNCFYEFEKRGFIKNQYLIVDIISPGNVLVIDIIIEELSSLANKL